MRVTYGSYQIGGEMRADILALQAYIDHGLKTGLILGPYNIDRYRMPNGKLVAKPMRYAALQADFESSVGSLGVSDVPALPHAKKGLMSDSLSPRDILRSDQIARINTLFADEFDAFGYPRL